MRLSVTTWSTSWSLIAWRLGTTFTARSSPIFRSCTCELRLERHTNTFAVRPEPTFEMRSKSFILSGACGALSLAAATGGAVLAGNGFEFERRSTRFVMAENPFFSLLLNPELPFTFAPRSLSALSAASRPAPAPAGPAPPCEAALDTLRVERSGPSMRSIVSRRKRNTTVPGSVASTTTCGGCPAQYACMVSAPNTSPGRRTLGLVSAAERRTRTAPCSKTPTAMVPGTITAAPASCSSWPCIHMASASTRSCSSVRRLMSVGMARMTS
mmetsp:Transcript_27513/g.93940  ORF Transcript_27513/g.93940 Transcript_27513/m.93940 type:complete len:270 (-) Transcript_27513:1858-2667(-)